MCVAGTSTKKQTVDAQAGQAAASISVGCIVHLPMSRRSSKCSCAVVKDLNPTQTGRRSTGTHIQVEHGGTSLLWRKDVIVIGQCALCTTQSAQPPHSPSQNRAVSPDVSFAAVTGGRAPQAQFASPDLVTPSSRPVTVPYPVPVVVTTGALGGLIPEAQVSPPELPELPSAPVSPTSRSVSEPGPGPEESPNDHLAESSLESLLLDSEPTSAPPQQATGASASSATRGTPDLDAFAEALSDTNQIIHRDQRVPEPGSLQQLPGTDVQLHDDRASTASGDVPSSRLLTPEVRLHRIALHVGWFVAD